MRLKLTGVVLICLEDTAKWKFHILTDNVDDDATERARHVLEEIRLIRRLIRGINFSFTRII